MPQQLGIIVLVDTANALADRTLSGNTYWFDNQKLHGSENQGTENLVSAINGSHWMDGSQATEQVLNWLPYSLGSLPPSVPRGYRAERSRFSDEEALADLEAVLNSPGVPDAARLERLRQTLGKRTRGRGDGRPGEKVLDVTGNLVTDVAGQAHTYPPPVITDIYGQAVDEKIMYPAEYGSPDLVTDGWYWAASVDTSRPGVYPYTLRVQLHDLVARDGDVGWEPVNFTCRSTLKITTEAKRNGFTRAGLGYLPVPPQS
ncbi:hypothetical protein PV682_17680 [Streptomyces niveiscabiei]|uniref:hypothetical protein n=1 Tax=Streptomyces niveiscabiei TaxID=164115 RepID=UPI0029A425F4|nr:hypothetical protein [Streptomyces niveiscabiei]MDX3383283.1 hypothetical protein [Streptomyces niveiscabiei]